MERMERMARTCTRRFTARCFVASDRAVVLVAGVLGRVHLHVAGGDQEQDDRQVGDEGSQQGGEEVIGPQEREVLADGEGQDRGGEEEEAADLEDLQEQVQRGVAGPDLAEGDAVIFWRARA